MQDWEGLDYSVSEWETGARDSSTHVLICLILLRLAAARPLEVPVQGIRRSVTVYLRRSMFRYRAIRQAVEVVATVGMALLFSYLILRTRW